MPLVKIYKLLDPRTNSVMYVGKTRFSLDVRLKGHLVDYNGSKKDDWITDLKSQGLRPSIVLLDEVNSRIAANEEARWIEKLGAPLNTLRPRYKVEPKVVAKKKRRCNLPARSRKFKRCAVCGTGFYTSGIDTKFCKPQCKATSVFLHSR